MRRAPWSARSHNARVARIAVPLALALVVGLVIGLKLIGGSGHLSLSAAGVCATPSTTASSSTAVPAAAAAASSTAAAPASSAAGTTSAVSATRLSLRRPDGRRSDHRSRRWRHVRPTPTASVTGTTVVTATTSAATPTLTVSATSTICPTASASASVTPTASPTATTPVAVANVSCDIIVPADPLSAAGLATPYQLTGANDATAAASGCTTLNSANLGAFVQATILDPATGALSVYEPLVITQGTTPAAAPVVPTLPAGAIVTIDIGFNGTNL